MLTKEQLIDAYDQGLCINTKNGNIKIVAILGDVYGVNHFNSNKVVWWLFEQFESQDATIEQLKLKYNGRAVKCDTVEQANWLFNKIKFDGKPFQIDINNYVVKIESEYGGGYCSIAYATKNNYEIISFSDYCKENNITEPKWIQGFEVKDGYKDVVMVSDDNKNWYLCILIKVVLKLRSFIAVDGTEWSYCRHPRKNEINEIKFVD